MNVPASSIVASPIPVIGGLVVLALAIFLVDLTVPNGVVDGFLYVLVIIGSQRSGLPRCPAIVAGLLMPLMILGFLGSPTEVPVWIAVTNRGVAMLTVWVASIAVACNVRQQLQRDSLLENLRSERDETRQALSEERADLSGRLVRDVDLELKMLEWRLTKLRRSESGAQDLQTEALMLGRAVHRTRNSVRAMSLQLNHGDVA